MAMVETPVPRWLKILVTSKVCTPHGQECRLCSNHANKVDMNLFCLECCIPVCHICWVMHTYHPYLQIRRYVYNAVVNVEDLNGRFDCSSIQSYTNNGSQVVFIKREPQAWPTRQCGSVCITCVRSLKDSFIFCSLSCKVEYLQMEATKGPMNNPNSSSASSYRKRKRKSSAPRRGD